ncbi:MAG TPA: nuclear transport factor 2 family protein [Sphingomicrobium sp.]|nr:nuclear transport factor 2 family protein [Sphingomicrobium sp.]
MADLTPVIETMEHRWMRGWVNRDAKAMKAITASGFILLTGSKPPAILDRRSWLDAATTRWLCSSYRFGDFDVREHGDIAIFAAKMDLKATMDRDDWSGPVWITDVWRKSRVRRRWKLVQRVLSKSDETPKLPAAIRSLQLWK